MILVTGASGVVGTPLCERLASEGTPYLSVSREQSKAANCVQWDLGCAPDDALAAKLADVTTLIHCAPIWLLPPQLDVLSAANINRMIVFSSTSVLSKQDSGDASEQALVEQLAQAERALLHYSQAHGIDLTILRPSMIYGYARDQNVSHIAGFIKKWGFMLLAGRGKGLRRPVHADDLVDVSLAIPEAKVTYGKTYTLAGQESLSYRQMVERIALGLRQKPRVLMVPVWLFRFALKLASMVSSFAYTAEMADRMNQDLSYDISAAQTDFDYRPQAFLSDPTRDLALNDMPSDKQKRAA